MEATAYDDDNDNDNDNDDVENTHCSINHIEFGPEKWECMCMESLCWQLEQRGCHHILKNCTSVIASSIYIGQ